MIDDILLALWFFAPAGIANMVPPMAVKVPGLKNWNTAVDGGKTWRGKRILGDHKTWRGLVAGIVAGILFVWLQSHLVDNYAWAANIAGPLDYSETSIVALGFLLSFGALGGDMLKSFAKRQFNVASGGSWFPFDQLDYIVGGLALSSLIVQPPAAVYCWIIVIFFGLHLLVSYLGYLLKFKQTPI